MLGSDGSIVWVESGGPQPDGSITAYVAGVVSGYVPTDDPTYLEIETNQIALHGGTNIVIREDGTGTNLYFDYTGTNLVLGTTEGTAYDGASGAAASDLAYEASTNAEAARQTATNAQAVANAALPKAGGTMTGELFYGTNRLYLGTDTNAPWVMGLGATNIQFGAGTNRAIFGSPW
jgi:hypothetical protein